MLAIQRIRERFPAVSAALAVRIVEVADDVGADPFELARLIAFESGGRFDPRARNPSSGATGLIQFMPRTAERLGTTTEALAELSAVDQMRYVRLYLDAVRRGRWPDDPRALPLDTAQALQMAVFYPPFRDKPPTAPFPANVQANNPGIRTAADYAAKVARVAGVS